MFLDAVDKVITTLQQAIDKYGPALVHASQQQVQANVAQGRQWTGVLLGTATAIGAIGVFFFVKGIYLNRKDKMNSGDGDGNEVCGALLVLTSIGIYITGFAIWISTNYVANSSEWQVLENLRKLGP